MPYVGAKVYNDGSHYIAIPQNKFKRRRRSINAKGEMVAVTVEDGKTIRVDERKIKAQKEAEKDYRDLVEMGIIDEEENVQKSADKSIIKQKYEISYVSKKDIFDKTYEENKDLTRSELRGKLFSALRPLFKNKEETDEYIRTNLARKRHNLNAKKNRAWRKARLAHFNYFCTYTYDSQKADEATFERGLRKTLQNLSSRRGWRYMGVWERGGKTERLHFHALINIPDGQMVGEFTEVTDYNTEKHCMQTQIVNSYFGERFGRTTFEEIVPQELDVSLNYILKYIEKTGEKIIYSKGLYMYFQSDVMDDDIITKMETEHPEQRCEKYILFDDFTCIDDGEIIGTATAETIEKMPHCN